MKIKSNNLGSENYQVKDEMGNYISFCKSFDTETKEVEIYVLASNSEKDNPKFIINNKEVLSIKVILPGAKLISKTTGKEIF